MVERLILSSRSVERMRQRIEAFGNGGELLRFWRPQPHPVIATFEIGETTSRGGGRIGGKRLGSGQVDARKQRHACKQGCDDLIHEVSPSCDVPWAAAGIGIATPDGAFQDAGEVAQASLRTTELSSVPEDRFCDIAASDCVLRRFASRPGLLNQCGLTTRWLLPVVHAAGVSTEPRGAGWMVDLHVRAAQPRSYPLRRYYRGPCNPRGWR